MSQYDSGSREVSGWAAGRDHLRGDDHAHGRIFQVINGLVAIFNDGFFIVTQNYTFDLDITAWGWIHLLLGLLLLFAGWALYSQKLWAAMTALVVADLSAIENFFFIPYYPFWSLLIIALCVWVIWALTRPGAVPPPELAGRAAALWEWACLRSHSVAFKKPS